MYFSVHFTLSLSQERARSVETFKAGRSCFTRKVQCLSMLPLFLSSLFPFLFQSSCFTCGRANVKSNADLPTLLSKFIPIIHSKALAQILSSAHSKAHFPTLYPIANVPPPQKKEISLGTYSYCIGDGIDTKHKIRISVPAINRIPILGRPVLVEKWVYLIS